MNNVEKLNELNYDIERIKVEMRDGNQTVNQHNALKVKRDQLQGHFDAIAKSVYSDFRRFVGQNPTLFAGWWVMQRSTDRVISTRLKKDKDAVLILLENTFDACYDRNVVLVPFDFMVDPEAFKVRRTAYIKEYHRQCIANQIAHHVVKIGNHQDEINKLTQQLSEFDEG